MMRSSTPSAPTTMADLHARPPAGEARRGDIHDIVKRLPHDMVDDQGVPRRTTRTSSRITSRVGLHGVQLQGKEPLSEVRWVREHLQARRRGTAAGDPRSRPPANGPAVVAFDFAESRVSAINRRSQGWPGGIHACCSRVADARDVADAMKPSEIYLWGVDVSSGVEAVAGRRRSASCARSSRAPQMTRRIMEKPTIDAAR